MDLLVRLSWVMLAAVHAAPAAVLFKPSLIEAMYSTSPQGDIGVLLTHRGAAFLAVLVTALWAAFDSSVRRLCTVVLAISIIGFVIVYVLAEMPAGPLRRIALVDVAALAPLALVTWAAWWKSGSATPAAAT